MSELIKSQMMLGSFVGLRIYLALLALVASSELVWVLTTVLIETLVKW